MPDGTVFAVRGRRVVVEEMAALVGSLGRVGPPVVVVLDARLEGKGGLRHAEALAWLGRRLPLGVNVYVFGSGTATLSVTEAGTLESVVPAA